jgi:hypothetical protein
MNWGPTNLASHVEEDFIRKRTSGGLLSVASQMIRSTPAFPFLKRLVYHARQSSLSILVRSYS